MGEPAWAEWIGRVEERTDALSPHVASMLAATLSDGEARDLSSGAPMPPLWHWAAFHTDAAHDELGPDGHPKLGRFLPPVPLERRMWAGGRLAFHAPLAIGEEMRRCSEILKVSEKEGGAGPMVFVTVGHRIEGERGFAIEEEQDIVYIAMPDAYRPPKPVPAPDGAAFDIAVAMDTRRLFRYSAATFNAHRIHYDLPYAMGVEKYPGLVVHGPMQATLLMGAAIRHRGGSPARFRFRGVHPMFHTHDLRLIGLDDGAAMELCTAAPPADGGHQGLRARAEWA
jgi:3-methylfumaryl-CoA hydratase